MQNFKHTEIGVIPSDWDVKTLGEVLNVKHGKSQKEIEDKSGKYPILGTGGLMGYTNQFLYDKPSVLIGRKGTIDKPQFMNTPFWTVDTLFYTEIFKNILPKYIYYKFLQIDWYSYNEASGVPSLNAKTIKTIQIPVPPLPEQARIAAALSDADALIQTLTALIAKKRNIKQAAMQTLLKPKEGWEVRKLGEVCDSLSSGKSNTQSQEGAFPIFGSTGIIGKGNIFDYHGNKILVARVGANAGTVNIVNGKYCVSDNTLIISLKSIADINFIYNLLTYFQLNKLVFGSGQPLITGGQLNKLEIPFPPLAEQTRIATILSDMDDEIAVLATKLEKYQAIKTGMMQELLTGRVRLCSAVLQNGSRALTLT